ncbi:hypothetical protein [Microbulbifer sediminum]|uniref:hypothetical protein n=1 Tax=Microbulbifer sediminum TaxID=2904250 RepID=UPI001F27BB20|nr:hypothetical protein [Microbulbifer sediminum]
MAKFKGFITFIAFTWLWGCGFFAVDQWIARGEIAWLGMLLSSWGLPVWLLLRYWRPQKFRADERESGGLTAVLSGLAVVLLTDTDIGLALYLSILNLGLVLLYLFHFSSLHHPPLPVPGDRFPALAVADGHEWLVAECLRQQHLSGALVIVLRGSFCASSRELLADLPSLAPALKKYNMKLVLVSTEPEGYWPEPHMPDKNRHYMVTLDASADDNRIWTDTGAVPLWVRLLGVRRAGRRRRSGIGACRPSYWLLDRDGYVLWRFVPDNYRKPPPIQLLRSQLSRIDDV